MEHRLWCALRGLRGTGIKFRRQHIIYPFIVDFCCVSLKLIIELDGVIHLEDKQRKRDQSRDRQLRAQGYDIIRIPKEYVSKDLPQVLCTLDSRMLLRQQELAVSCGDSE